MKKLLLLLLCVPLIGLGQTINENHLTRFNIKGNVKEIIETSFEPHCDVEPQKSDFSKCLRTNIAKYNEDGNMTEKISYNADGEPYWKIKYQYDEDGKETELTFYDINNAKLYEKYKYQYDEDGNMTEETWYNGDGELYWKIKYQYDEGGNRTEETYYNADGRLQMKSKYQYDEDGNMTEKTSYDDGELYGKRKYQYDEFDKLNNWTVKIEDEHFRPTDIIEREIEYYE